MEIVVPHRVEYEVKDLVSVQELIGTLQANQTLAEELGPLLEGMIVGLTVQRVQLQVRDISHGSLREYFFLALILAFQDDLKGGVPPMVEALLGVQFPDHYDGIITAATLLLVFYGSEYLLKRTDRAVASLNLQEQISGLVTELSSATGMSEEAIRQNLEKQFAKPTRLRALGRAAAGFFRPSRNQRNDPIVVGDKRIESKVVAEIPVDAPLEDEDMYTPVPGVRIEIHAKDRDKGNVGWAGVVPSLSDKRLRMQLYPTVDRETLWDKELVWGDVLVVYKPDGDQMRPSMFYLVRVLDEAPPGATP
ncbi:MAG: hypothetical protein AB7S70_01230 [Hyphomicrobium sp.]|uniref:hypothetical protein n=1 Tax=Hyphomicrobium sp. TaxID=82 RepID=UPI003D0B7B4D